MWIILIFFTGTVSITSLASTLEILYLWVKYYMHKECILLSGEKTFPQVLLPYIGFSINLPWREFRSQYKKKIIKEFTKIISRNNKDNVCSKIKMQINQWMDGWMNGRMDRRTACVCLPTCLCTSPHAKLCLCMHVLLYKFKGTNNLTATESARVTLPVTVNC